jgi:hypothetical protein
MKPKINASSLVMLNRKYEEVYLFSGIAIIHTVLILGLFTINNFPTERICIDSGKCIVKQLDVIEKGVIYEFRPNIAGV